MFYIKKKKQKKKHNFVLCFFAGFKKRFCTKLQCLSQQLLLYFFYISLSLSLIKTRKPKFGKRHAEDRETLRPKLLAFNFDEQNVPVFNYIIHFDLLCFFFVVPSLFFFLALNANILLLRCNSLIEIRKNYLFSTKQHKKLQQKQNNNKQTKT